MKKILRYGSVFVLFCTFNVLADKSITVQYNSSRGSTESGSANLIIGKHLRFNGPAQQEPMTAIYRTDGDRMLILNDADKEFFEINAKTFEGLNNVMHQMMAQIEAQIAHLPEEQKEAMRQNMQQYMGNAMPNPQQETMNLTWEDTGETQTIGKFDCKKFILKDTEGVIQGECFIAPYAQVKLSDTEMGALKQFFNFLDKIMQSMHTLPFFKEKPPKVANLNTLDGMPVKIIGYQNGQPTDTIDILSIQEMSEGGTPFEVPGDYKKANVPF